MFILVIYIVHNFVHSERNTKAPDRDLRNSPTEARSPTIGTDKASIKERKKSELILKQGID